MAVRARNPSHGSVVSHQALALWLCRKEFPQGEKVVKQAKDLLRGKMSTVWIDTRGRLRVTPLW